MRGKQSRLRSFLKAALIIFLALIVLIPLAVYSIMAMGFPPIVGNLAAAQVIRKYAAQVYPEWEPEGIWAGYDTISIFPTERRHTLWAPHGPKTG